jgi:hypothetical protein
MDGGCSAVWRIKREAELVRKGGKGLCMDDDLQEH